jgi:hypothetical protein
MSFFNKYPLTEYTSDGYTLPIVDITKRCSIIDEFKQNTAEFTTYTIRDGERPEDVSMKFYGTPFYHWIIMLYNNIVDPYYDWPMSSTQFDKFVNSKYTDPFNIKHYVLENGAIVATDDSAFVSYVEIDGAVTVPDELGNTVLSGFGTAFKSQLRLDTVIRVGSEETMVVSIESDTRATVNPPIISDAVNLGTKVYVKIASVGNPVTFYDFDSAENDAKREIYIPSPDVAQRIDREYAKVLNG